MHIGSFHIVPLTASMIALATGCAAAGNPASPPAQPDPGLIDVTVAALPAADLAGLYIAQEQGLFTRQGLRVTILPIASSRAVIADQLKGQVDISAGAYIAYISAQAAGARFRILAEADTLQPDTRVLVTTADSPITTVADLAGKTIGVNGTNSIGTLLISVLLTDHGVSPAKVRFETDQQGFPAMPAQLQRGEWNAAFLAEPYITLAGERYGERVLADLDQGSARNFPIDGYVATSAWVQRHPKTAAAFVRSIEAGQLVADTDPAAVQAAIGKFDQLPPTVTAAIALSGYPVGPVNEPRIQRVAQAMLQFGLLGRQYAAEVKQGTLVGSMVGAALPGIGELGPQQSHEYQVLPAVRVQLGFAAYPFPAEPAREIAVDRAVVEGQYLKLDAMHAQDPEGPGQDQSSDLLAQASAAQPGDEQSDAVRGTVLVRVHLEPGVTDAVPAVLDRPLVGTGFGRPARCEQVLAGVIAPAIPASPPGRTVAVLFLGVDGVAQPVVDIRLPGLAEDDALPAQGGQRRQGQPIQHDTQAYAANPARPPCSTTATGRSRVTLSLGREERRRWRRNRELGQQQPAC